MTAGWGGVGGGATQWASSWNQCRTLPTDKCLSDWWCESCWHFYTYQLFKPAHWPAQLRAPETEIDEQDKWWRSRNGGKVDRHGTGLQTGGSDGATGGRGQTGPRAGGSRRGYGREGPDGATGGWVQTGLRTGGFRRGYGRNSCIE